MTIRSTYWSLSPIGTESDDLRRERCGDTGRRSRQSDEQPVVEATAISQPAATRIEAEARNQREVDSLRGNQLAAHRGRLTDVPHSRRELVLEVLNQVQIQAALGAVHPGKNERLAVRTHAPREGIRIELGAHGHVGEHLSPPGDTLGAPEAFR